MKELHRRIWVGGFAILMGGKSLTCRKVLYESSVYNRGSETLGGEKFAARQVRDLPRIGVAEPSRK